MTTLTLLQKINKLTWWNEVNKLKEILKGLLTASENNGVPTLQDITTAGNITTDEIIIDNGDGTESHFVEGAIVLITPDGEVRVSPTSINITKTATDQFSEITAENGIGLINNLDALKTFIRNEDVTADNIVLQIPDRPTGEYTLALQSAISGTFTNPTSITVANGIITAIS